jgi:hypothetical protein
MVCLRQPKVSSRPAHGQLKVCLRSAHGHLTVCYRSAYGQITVSSRPAIGLLTVSSRSAHGQLKVCLQSDHGQLMFSLRSAHRLFKAAKGQLTSSSRSPYGQLTASSWSAHGLLTVSSRLTQVRSQLIKNIFVSTRVLTSQLAQLRTCILKGITDTKINAITVASFLVQFSNMFNEHEMHSSGGRVFSSSTPSRYTSLLAADGEICLSVSQYPIALETL